VERETEAVVSENIFLAFECAIIFVVGCLGFRFCFTACHSLCIIWPLLSEMVVRRNKVTREMVGVAIGITMGMILMSRMEEWHESLWNVGWPESEYGMLECCISGGCAGLGNLYIN